VLRRGQGLRPFPRTPFSATGALPPLRSGQFVLDEAEHFPAQSRCQRRSLRWCSGSSRNAVRLHFGNSVQLRRNPHPERSGAVCKMGMWCPSRDFRRNRCAIRLTKNKTIKMKKKILAISAAAKATTPKPRIPAAMRLQRRPSRKMDRRSISLRHSWAIASIPFLPSIASTRNPNPYLSRDLNHPSVSRQARGRLTQSRVADAFHRIPILPPLADSNSITHSSIDVVCGAVSSTNVCLAALRRRTGIPPTRFGETDPTGAAVALLPQGSVV